MLNPYLFRNSQRLISFIPLFLSFLPSPAFSDPFNWATQTQQHFSSITPTPTSTETVTPTFTATSSPTITPTNTPRPENHLPKISIVTPNDLLVLIHTHFVVSVMVQDQDTGDPLEISIKTSIPVIDSREINLGNVIYSDYTLDTSQLGNFAFRLYAYDGSDTSSKEFRLTIINEIPSATPSPTFTPLPPVATPTPSFTPTPTSTEVPLFTPTNTPTVTPTVFVSAAVIITDNTASLQDLSGQPDHDAVNTRGLTLRWNLAGSSIHADEMKDIHIYVKKNQDPFMYLARTASSDAEFYEWKRYAPRTVPQFIQGPQLGDTYQFRVYFLTKLGSPLFYGPYSPSGSVEMLPLVTVTESETSLIDRSGDQVFQTASNRELVIRWQPDAWDLNRNDIVDFHVYVFVDHQFKATYLGRTGDPTAEVLVWKAGTRFLAPEYDRGPEFNHHYQFMIYALTRSGTPRVYGPFLESAPVEFLEKVP